MRIALLRGAVPKDRDPREIDYVNLEQCDDIYIHLAHGLADGDHSNVSYFGGKRRIQELSKSFYLIKDKKPLVYHIGPEVPEVIWARGGFSEYHNTLTGYQESFKIYYGAGQRFLPIEGFHDYQLILVDSEEQLAKGRQKFPHIPVHLWPKPAPPQFKPVKCEKEYDVCFIANGTQPFKGHDFVAKTAPKDLKILHLGFESEVDKLDNVTHKRVPRLEMPKWISKCKVGILCCEEIDSCPRVLPEMLACGVPVGSLDRVRFWRDAYVSQRSVWLASKGIFWDAVRAMLYETPNPYPEYRHTLSTGVSTTYLNRLICSLRESTKKPQLTSSAS